MTNKTTNLKKPVSTTLNDNHRILAQGRYINNNTWQTGLNNNDLIIGVSGAGKTRGYVIPNILHSNESMVIVDTKNTLSRRLSPHLKKEGYEVWNLNFAKMDQSPMGYNPLSFIERYTDQSYPYNTQDIEMLTTSIRQIKNQCRETENSNRQSVMQFPARLAPPASFTSTTQKCLSASIETQLTPG